MSGSDAATVCAELRAAVDEVGFGVGFNSLATGDAAGMRIVELAGRLPGPARRRGLDLAAGRRPARATAAAPRTPSGASPATSSSAVARRTHVAEALLAAWPRDGRGGTRAPPPRILTPYHLRHATVVRQPGCSALMAASTSS